MGQRWKQTQDAADFTLRERGPADHPEHKVELSCSYNAEFCGDGTKPGALMVALPRGAVYFDRDFKVWRILEEYRENAEMLALKFYRHVYRTVGDRVTDLKRGTTVEEGRLF